MILLPPCRIISGSLLSMLIVERGALFFFVGPTLIQPSLLLEPYNYRDSAKPHSVILELHGEAGTTHASESAALY